MAACKDGLCSLPRAKAPRPKARKQVSRPSSGRILSPSPKTHKHNCSECHDHKHTPSLTHKIHEKNGHQCTKQDCDIKEPHGHIHKHEEEHVHGPGCNHHHHEEAKKPSFKPLEEFINDTKLPKWLKQLSLNASFLAPALLIHEGLEGSKIPGLVRTLLSISGMHFTNRGTKKLGRLGLTSLVASGAQMSGDSRLGKSFIRFIATSLVAIIEKFSSESKKGSELEGLIKNLKDPKQWKELFPSLVNVEAKVQLLVPLVNGLINQFTKDLSPSLKAVSKLFSQIALTSLSFVGFDKLIQTVSKKFGKDSFVASMVSATCGCCGSPVCAAAATDSALQNTL